MLFSLHLTITGSVYGNEKRSQAERGKKNHQRRALVHFLDRCNYSYGGVDLSGINRLSEFTGKKLSQGRVLATPTTRRWRKEEWDRAEEQERKMLFYNFYGLDQGRSRVVVFVAETEKEALAVLEEHNSNADQS